MSTRCCTLPAAPWPTRSWPPNEGLLGTHLDLSNLSITGLADGTVFMGLANVNSQPRRHVLLVGGRRERPRHRAGTGDWRTIQAAAAWPGRCADLQLWCAAAADRREQASTCMPRWPTQDSTGVQLPQAAWLSIDSCDRHHVTAH